MPSYYITLGRYKPCSLGCLRYNVDIILGHGQRGDIEIMKSICSEYKMGWYFEVFMWF